MTNRRKQKKRGKKNYEGTQYRGGRAKGEKNLKRTPEGLVNQHGVVFTEAEKKALEQAVNTANRKRARMLKEEAKLPRIYRNQDTGDTVATLHLMGEESDFILAKKTKSLQRFKRHQDYERYMKNLERVNQRDYIAERVKRYKRNYMQALENEFGDEAKDIKMHVRMMKPEEFMKKIQSSDGDLEIWYIYDISARGGRLNVIRAGWGMKLKEDALPQPYS